MLWTDYFQISNYVWMVPHCSSHNFKYTDFAFCNDHTLIFNLTEKHILKIKTKITPPKCKKRENPERKQGKKAFLIIF